MYGWGRLARMVIGAKARGPVGLLATTRHDFRCGLSDIDNYGHMNNARYPMLADIGRIELFFRNGIRALGPQRNWWPLMGGVQTVFLREIKFMQKFQLITSMETWDDRQLLGLHRFMLPDGTVSAMVRTSLGVYDYGERRFVPIDEVAKAVGETQAPRPLSEEERVFLASHAALRAEGRRLSKGG